jgi:streptogramin lyase
VIVEFWEWHVRKTSFLLQLVTLLLNATAVMAPLASAQTVTEFPADQFGYVYEIAAGPDGALWFTSNSSKIGRIPTTATATDPQITAFSGPSRILHGIIAGSDGAMWFTAPPNSIGRIPTSATVTNPQITTFSPTTGEPAGITVGPDGALWFPEETADSKAKIGRIPTTATVSNPQFTFFADPDATYHYPRSIITGADGALWFIAEDKNTLASMIMRLATTQGSKPELIYTFPAGFSCGTAGEKCTASGPDGAIWFVEPSNNSGISKIARIPTTARNGNAQVNEYGLPAGHTPRAITAGPDGALWFTESPGDYIGRITTSGVITEFPIPANAGSSDIATGPDGALWFVETAKHKIGRLSPPTAGQSFIGYVKIPGPLSTSSGNWDAMTGLSLVLPTSSASQTRALVTLNVPNAYASGTNYPGCTFAIEVNNTIDMTQPVAGFTSLNGFGRTPTTLVVMVPLSTTGPTTVQAMWQSVRGANVVIDSPASLSAVIGSPSP